MSLFSTIPRCYVSCPLCTAQPNNDISAYTYERTLMMEQRSAMLEGIHGSDLALRRTRTVIYDVMHVVSRACVSRYEVMQVVSCL